MADGVVAMPLGANQIENQAYTAESLEEENTQSERNPYYRYEDKAYAHDNTAGLASIRARELNPTNQNYSSSGCLIWSSKELPV